MNNSKKKDMKDIVRRFPGTTMRLTLFAFRGILLLILIYVVISIIILSLTKKFEFLLQIVTFGVSGFFAFFMGYFGWMFANSITEWFIKLDNKEKKNEENHNGREKY